MDQSAVQLAALDLETHVIQPGLAAPPIVCGSYADARPGSETLLSKADALYTAAKLLAGRDWIAGANIAYDFGCLSATVTERSPEQGDLIDAIFAKYERGEVFDLLIAEALDAIAKGCLGINPHTGEALRKYAYNPATQTMEPGKVSKRYGLENVCLVRLGRVGVKANDVWKLRYHELENVPMSEWPPEAQQYPRDDARNSYDAAAAQFATCENVSAVIPTLGITHQTLNARAAWAMHLGSIWGLRTNRAAVDALAAKTEAKHTEAIERFKASGLIKPDGKENGPLVKERVARAYGAHEVCSECNGTRKVPSTKTKSLINCKGCDSSGLKLPDDFPALTDSGKGISCSRDTLAESGDDLLEAYAGVSEIEKIRDTYLPFVRDGLTRPINVKPNVIVESGRASYDGLIQLLPRKGGIRECFEARPGFAFVSVDYSALELCTLAQVTLWVVGWSRMAEIIQQTGDPGRLHSAFGASMLSVEEAVFLSRVASGDYEAKNGRQMAKAANFGFPGFMGAPRFVLTKRKEGLRLCIAAGAAPVCEACQGAIGHKSCRSCYGRGAICGTEKTTEWKGRKISPTCVQCIEIAARLRTQWFEQWPEVAEYFKWVQGHEGFSDGLAQMVSPGTDFVRGRLGANGANHPFQHLAAVGAKHALWKVTQECFTKRRSPLFGSRPVIFAHDEVIAEVRLDRLHDAAYRMSELMVGAMREVVRDVPVKAEPAACLRWYKDAEPAHDDVTGKLIPWEPKPKNGPAKIEHYVQKGGAPAPSPNALVCVETIKLGNDPGGWKAEAARDLRRQADALQGFGS